MLAEAQKRKLNESCLFIYMHFIGPSIVYYMIVEFLTGYRGTFSPALVTSNIRY